MANAIAVAVSAAVAATWTRIVARIARRPSFQVLPEAAMATIEAVIMRNHDEAFDRWPAADPDSKKCRVHFWKECLLEAVGEDAASAANGPATPAGLWATYFHEYVASIERAAQRHAENLGEDDDILPPAVDPRIAQLALDDAYASCRASLDNFKATPMWP